MSELEHINITVRDAKSTANTLCTLFDWKIRWQGEVLDGAGYSIHIGSDTSYLAIYAPHDGSGAKGKVGPLNHVGVVVGDLEQVEKRVIAAGYKPHLHADYEPGRRFYFDDDNGIEFEVACYE